jgi:hypothetical protein
LPVTRGSYLCIYFHNVNYLERAFDLEINFTNRFFLLYLLSVNISFSSFRVFDLLIIEYLGKKVFQGS